MNCDHDRGNVYTNGQVLKGQRELCFMSTPRGLEGWSIGYKAPNDRQSSEQITRDDFSDRVASESGHTGTQHTRERAIVFAAKKAWNSKQANDRKPRNKMVAVDQGMCWQLSASYANCWNEGAVSIEKNKMENFHIGFLASRKLLLKECCNCRQNKLLK